MLKLQGKLPREIYVACSGGVDSMAAVDFLRRNHDVFVLHFNHGTAHGKRAIEFVGNYCTDNDIPFLTNQPHAEWHDKDPRESKEEYWRRIRYDWLERCTNRQVVTAHHLVKLFPTVVTTGSCVRFDSLVNVTSTCGVG